MDNTPSTFSYCQRLTFQAWICRHVPLARSRVSHTRVQVLSSTNFVPPRPEFNCSSPQKLLETWTKRLRSNQNPERPRENEKRSKDTTAVFSAKAKDQQANTHNTGGLAAITDASQSDHSGRVVHPNTATDKVDVSAGHSRSSYRVQDKNSSAEKEDLPVGCLCIPILPLHRLRRKRRAKVAPFNLPSPFVKTTSKSATSGEDRLVQPQMAEVSVFGVEDRDDQDSPCLGLPSHRMMKEDLDEWCQRSRSEAHFEREGDEVKGISRESISLPPRPKTSRGIRQDNGRNDQPFKGSEKSREEISRLDELEQDEEAVLMGGEPEIMVSRTIMENGNSDISDSEEVLYCWKNVEAKNSEDGRGMKGEEVVVCVLGEGATSNNTRREYLPTLSPEDLPPRPKTARGFRRECGRGDLRSVSGGVGVRTVSEVIRTLTREEDREEEDEYVISGADLKSKKSSSSLNSGEALSIWRNPDVFYNEDEVEDQAGLSSKGYEYDTRPKIDKAIPSGQKGVSPSANDRNKGTITPKYSKESVDSDGVIMTPEDELEYDRQQREQWQLAGIGEWSVLCQDYDEDDYESECYLRMDELQKEQAIMEDWRAITERYQSIGVIQDLQNMQTLCKCTINQSERALRQFARICRGPVPLSKSGQTKAEAIASLSKKAQKQTRRISERISDTFMEFYQIFEELDILRERQDRVEESLQGDLEKRDASSADLSWSSSQSSVVTPRLISSRIQQRELDMDLVDKYMEDYRVKSTSLFNVMPTIYEDEIFEVEECREEESEGDFPEYSGMDNVCFDGDDVRVNDTAKNNREDSSMMNRVADEQNNEDVVEKQEEGEGGVVGLNEEMRKMR
ncbi:uncharacterized protein LOC110973159 [Acanthaster planci]|uniref:Uncharacterized protein LOC110973159 n=1 Tax=Acanthaster planci TaxID=133434 RepID=A0A8B7XFA7_ACAPL|nr:uncharacterized protein LOC110973159 [Acanthaster planci]